MNITTLNTTREMMHMLGFSTVKGVTDLAKKHGIKPKRLKDPNKKLSGFLWDKDDFKSIQKEQMQGHHGETLNTSNEMANWFGIERCSFYDLVRRHELKPRKKIRINGTLTALWDKRDFEQFKKARKQRVAEQVPPAVLAQRQMQPTPERAREKQGYSAVSLNHEADLRNSILGQQALKDLKKGIAPCSELGLVKKYGLTRYMAGLVMRKYEASRNG